MFVYLLQIITGILFFLALHFAQSELLAQNDNFNDLDESGAIVLKKSIDTISRFVRVECDMRVSTFVGGVEFPANGKYEEQAVAASGTYNVDNNDNNNTDNSPKNQLSEFQRTMYRQELNFITDKLPVQAEPNRVILVCYPNKNDSKNGNIWQFRSINGNKTLQQINIDAVEAAIKKSFGTGADGNVQEQIVVGDASMFKQVGMLWNVGGIAGVLGQISRFYEFVEPPKVDMIENTKTVKLVGSLRKTYFDILLKDHGGLESNDRYPSNLPCDIEVYIGADDHFPRKIRYLNRKTELAKPTNLLVEINYTNIKINGNPIPEHRFSTFQSEVPTGVSKIDSSTEQYIKSLGLQRP
ncbi:MAG: hypothetical protein LBK06_07605 [Planctomycetaceae bacterium]|nr:hypothetical protein [Planctomycetaceae bacterium]